MTEYVVGFLRGNNVARVVLIEKCRPEWQKGQLNGVGGHIETGETPLAAMQREFHEETGLHINDWELGVVMTGGTWQVYFFSAWGPGQDARTKTDETVRHVPCLPLPLNVIPNLRWLIPLCFDSDIRKPVYLQDKTEPAAGDLSGTPKAARKDGGS